MPGFGVHFELDDELGPVIAIDSDRGRRLPSLVREFEIAHACVRILDVEKRADWNPNISNLRYKDPKRYKEVTVRLKAIMREESKKLDPRSDCEALDRLRRNQFVGYKELRVLADFYASAAERFGDFPRELTLYRAKNLLGCSRRS